MVNHQVHRQGWISLLIEPKYEHQAKQMRAKRDRTEFVRYLNLL